MPSRHVSLSLRSDTRTIPRANSCCSIPRSPDSKHVGSGRCLAFEKYDGTNLHWTWTAEFGWIRFGTRRDDFDLFGKGIADFHTAHPGLEDVVDVFQRDYADDLEKIFRARELYQDTEVTVFTEYFGPNSFAGRHRLDDLKELMLFDVQTSAVGLVGPERFVSDFGDIKSARVVYRGKYTGKFADDVRKGKYHVAEGVVCKGGNGPDLWMIKIKTYAYLEKLKQAFADKWEDYWE